MTAGDHSDGPDHSRRRGRRGSPADQSGLQALGDSMAGRTESPSEGADRARSGRSGPDQNPPRVANEEGLLALEAQMPRRRSKRSLRAEGRSKRSRRIRRGVSISLVVVLVLVVGGAGYAYYLTHGFHRVEVKGLHGALTTGKEAGTENILMVGSTSRCALKVQNPAYGLCSEGVNGVNSDVIMILHADPAHHRLALLSIPRDLFIPNARAEGPDKIDAGLYEGLTQLVSAIEEDFGIPIQHAVSLNFDQFANVVDALQGINMAFPISVFDRDSGLNVQAATCVHLNGTQALQVVRSRHLQYKTADSSTVVGTSWPREGLSDLARIRRDHEFLRVLATAVAKQGLDNPITDTNLINSVKSDLTFDQSWSVSDMADLVLDFHSVNIGSVPQLTLPVAEVLDPNGPSGDLIYNGSNRQQVEFPAQGQGQSTIDQVLGISATTDSLTGTPLPAPSSVTVSVMNGTGAYNQATDTSASLAALGFHMVGAGDTPPTGDVAETVVYYGSHTPATEAAAEAVARSMSGSVIMAYDPSQVADNAQVTVVTGSQFAVNAPTATPTPTSGATGSAITTTAPAPSSTTSTTSAASAAIATPSPATSKLQHWDPRACPAGATPTVPAENPT
jgi:polyisoprenyl-teichoic acid--peptidoglycan teichoic acid transferase